MHSAHFLSDVPICIDGRMLHHHGTGVSTYARSLVSAVELIADNPLILSPPSARSLLPHWLAAAGRGVQRVWPATGDDGAAQLHSTDLYRRAHVHFGYHRRLFRLRCSSLPFGIMHWTYPVPMRMEGWINLYTVHDMIPIKQPDLSPIDPARHGAILRAIASSADGLVTVSDDARQALLSGLDGHPALVINCGQAADVSALASGAGDLAALPAGLIADSYLLIVGSVEPRKNIEAVLAAYRSSNVTIPLVIAGPDGWQAQAINRAIAATPGAIRLPYLPRSALLGVIAGARALMFASLAEGFGLPMIEAMALGIPVLTSDRGALAEIAGDAALLIDPTDPQALQRGMERIVADDALRGQLVARGITRAGSFSIAAFADRLRAAYHTVLRGSRYRADVRLPEGV